MNETHTNPPPKAPLLFRQGDILVERIEALPTYLTLKAEGDRVVLAKGEATGHAHVLPSKLCRTEKSGGDIYLELIEPGELRHEEHAPITLAPGKYRVIRQREYQPGAYYAIGGRFVED